jgi:hypothetical protein
LDLQGENRDLHNTAVEMKLLGYKARLSTLYATTDSNHHASHKAEVDFESRDED